MLFLELVYDSMGLNSVAQSVRSALYSQGFLQALQKIVDRTMLPVLYASCILSTLIAEDTKQLSCAQRIFYRCSICSSNSHAAVCPPPPGAA